MLPAFVRWWRRVIPLSSRSSTRVAGRSNYNAVRLVQCLLGTAAIYLLARIAERLFNRRVALATAVVMAVYPFAIFYPATIMSETLFLFLVAANVLGLFELRDDPSLGKAALVGVVAGLAVLTRPQHLLFVAVPLVWLLLVRRQNKSGAATATGRRCCALDVMFRRGDSLDDPQLPALPRARARLGQRNGRPVVGQQSDRVADVSDE